MPKLSQFRKGKWVEIGLQGQDGLSAYEIAKNNGFKGSEKKWLNSLVGKDGESIIGRPGKDGANGLSAYEIAKQKGFNGSEKDWLDSLKGRDGLNGTSGGGIKRIVDASDVKITDLSDNQSLTYDAATKKWVNETVAAGSGTPGGSDTQVQFNDGGSFGGDAGLTYNKTTNALTVGDVLVDDEAYDATNWDGSLEVPTKNAVRDKIESLSAGSGHTIKEAGTPLTQRSGLNFGAGFDLSDDAGNDETDVALDLSEYTGADLPVAGGGTGAGTAEDARTNLGLVIGTNIQAYDSDLTTIAGLTATTNNIIQSVSSAWASRTPTQVTATLDAMVGDSGAGGTKGLVPAPATGDATKFLKGDGTWGTPSGSGDALTTDPLSQFAATTSLQLAGVISDETGSGSLVFGTSPGFTTAANPVSNDGAALGTTALGWSDLFLASGGVINFAASDTVLTHSTGVLTVSTGDLRVTTAGSNAASVVTVGGSQTITNKTFNSGTFNNLTVNNTTLNNAVIQSVNSLSIDNAVYIKWRNAANSADVNGLRLNASDVLEMDAALTLGTTNSLTCGSIELGAASDTTLSRSAAGVLAVEGVVIPSISSTNTLTNKRVTPRTGTTTSSATPTINTDNVDFYSLTAQTADITSFTTNLSGTPTEGQKLWIAITGTAARAITWGSSFEASTVALPTTTVSTNRLDVGFVWNTATSKWRCVATC